jgi:replicative DNA helicase
MVNEANATWRAVRERDYHPESFLNDEYLNAPDPIPTGIHPLDAILSGGMRPGLHVLGGEPGAGKSALALQICHNVVRAGGAALYFSIEMSCSQCVFRLLSLVSSEMEEAGRGKAFKFSHVGQYARSTKECFLQAKQAGGDLMAEAENSFGDPVALAHATYEQDYKRLAVVDDVNTLDGIRDLVKDVTEAQIKPLVVIDYLHIVGLADGAASDATTRVGDITRGLDLMGKERGIPVLALSALARSSRGDMHGFRDSSTIEYAGLSCLVLSKDKDDPEGVVRLSVVKNRFGPFGDDYSIPLAYDRPHNRFTETVETRSVPTRVGGGAMT